MREIKFRAWDDVKDRLLYLGEEDDIVFEFGGSGIVATDITEDEPNFKTLYHLIYLQYTGLKDKSEAGQEIWEGDIRKDALGRIFKVVYDNDLAAFYGEYTNGHYESLGDCGADSEFLGTVYQDPELFESK